MSAASRVVIASDALEALVRTASQSPHAEVGGVLLGFRVDDDVHVEDVVPIVDPAATGTRFFLRAQHRDETVRLFRSRRPPQSPVGYVGTWHSHLGDAGPSCTDRRTFHRELWRARDRLALMVVRSTDHGWLPTALTGRPRKLPAIADVVVV